MKLTLFFVVVVAAVAVGFAAAYPAEDPQVLPREKLAEGVAPADLAKDGTFFGHYGYRQPYYGGYYGGGYGGYGGYYRRPYGGYYW